MLPHAADAGSPSLVPSGRTTSAQPGASRRNRALSVSGAGYSPTVLWVRPSMVKAIWGSGGLPREPADSNVGDAGADLAVGIALEDSPEQQVISVL